jgi:hypothetical protein
LSIDDVDNNQICTFIMILHSFRRLLDFEIAEIGLRSYAHAVRRGLFKGATNKKIKWSGRVIDERMLLVAHPAYLKR